MQLDMHYYGTYALARAAGLTPKACQIIATAAQFVDDNAASYHIEFQDGGRIDSQATAHHPSSVARNLDPADQRRVWVPFHFLPGNDGQTFPERLLCRKDSPIAKAMVTTAGRPSGTAATASETAVISTSSQGTPWTRPTRAITATIKRQAMIKTCET